MAPRSYSWLRGALVGAVVLVGFVPTSAEAQPRSVYVGEFSGRSGTAVQRVIRRSIEREGLTLASSTDSASVTIEGTVSHPRRRRLRVQVEAHGSEGEVSRTFNGRMGVVRRRLRRWVRDDLPGLLPAESEPEAPTERVEATVPSEEVTPTAQPDETPATESASPAREGFVSIWIGLSVLRRELWYTDDLFGRLRGYVLDAGALPRAGLQYHFGQHFDEELLHGLSLRGGFEYLVGVESQSPQGSTHATEAFSAGGDIVYRLAIDEVGLSVAAGYVAHRFAIHASEDGAPSEVPHIRAHSIRTGVGFDWWIERMIGFFGEFAYLAPVVMGGIASDAWFGRASSGGIEASMGLGVGVDDFRFQASFYLRRFFFSLNPEPGDELVAGGAADDYMGAVFDIVYRPSWLQ